MLSETLAEVNRDNFAESQGDLDDNFKWSFIYLRQLLKYF